MANKKEMKKDVIEEKLDKEMPEKVKTQAEIYDEKIAKLKEDLEKVDDVEVLKKQLEEANAECEEFEKELSERKYTLPESVHFKDNTYDRSRVYRYITDLMNSMEVQWAAVLSMFEFIDWWKKASKDNLSEVPYHYYDTTLRILGQIKYKGYFDFLKILVVNTMFRNAHDQYTLDLSKYYYVHEKFDAISTRIEAIQAMTEPLSKKETK